MISRRSAAEGGSQASRVRRLAARRIGPAMSRTTPGGGAHSALPCADPTRTRDRRTRVGIGSFWLAAWLVGGCGSDSTKSCEEVEQEALDLLAANQACTADADCRLEHPARAVGLAAIISLAAGANHNCVATELGSVSCWGGSSHGETGSLDRRDQYVPRVVSDLSDVTEVAVGEDHSCVLHRGGRISCWGKAGVLGRDVGESFVPVPVRRISNAVTLTSGPNHVCAVLADGHVACWGDNQYGQLGVDEETVESSPIPVRVEGITDAVAVAAGGGHTCSVSADQSIRCWGSNASGQLGTPRIEYNTHTPQVIGGS